MKIALIYTNNEANVGRGAGYIAGSILRAGHDLIFFDTLYAPPDKVTDTVIHGDFDILMISSMTMLFPQALQIINDVKKRIKVPVLVGGIHSTIMGKSLLDEYKEIDYLCVGEGETMVARFLENFGKDSLFEINNLVYRKNGEIIQNPILPAENLDNLPEFPWHLFHRDSVILKDTGFLYTDATRGCPYNCSYCCNGIYLSHYGKSYLRHRPVEHVLNELHYLKKKYNPKIFYFGDEMILSVPGYANKLFRAIKDELNIPYGCMARVEHINKDIADFFGETGCKYIAMGIECGNEEFRKKHLNRFMSNEQIEKAFKLVMEKGIFASSFNMIGFPFDNDDDLTLATLRLNQKINPNYAQVTIFYPLPGTSLYKYCLNNDLIDKEKLRNLGNYFSDSPLKGKKLESRRNEMHWLLNPNDFSFSHDPAKLVKPLSLRKKLEKAAYVSPKGVRWLFRILYAQAKKVNALLKKRWD